MSSELGYDEKCGVDHVLSFNPYGEVREKKNSLNCEIGLWQRVRCKSEMQRQYGTCYVPGKHI